MSTINSRIREIRKDAKLNQHDFAKILGVTQAGVSHMEQDGHNVSDVAIKGICNYSGVSENYLRYGTLPKYIHPSVFNLDDFARQHGVTELELSILKVYFELDPEIRNAALNHFKQRFSSASSPWDTAPDTAEELERQFPPVHAEDVTGAG